jgi:hypothetical protein
MAIDKTVEVLDAEIIEREDPIKEGWIQKAYKMASALYEGLFDTTAPGDSSQAWSGHDHAQSGGPIARGCAISEDNGDGTPLFEANPITPRVQFSLDDFGKVPKFRYYASPLFDEYRSFLQGRLCYTAVNSKFTLYFVEVGGTATSKKSIEVSIELEETANESYPVWVDLPPIPMAPGRWNQLMIYGECEKYDSANAPSLKIYGIVLTEAPGLTTYGKSKLLSRLDSGIGSQASASGLAHVSFQPLEQTLVADEQPLDADTLSRVQWFANGLYEGVLDQRAPGANTQTCRGHDHDDYGGLAITRNKVCSLSKGESAPFTKNIGMMGEHGTSSPSTGSAIWHLADEDTSAGGLRSTAGVAHMIGPVSPGITNTGTSTAPYLDAYLYFTADASPAVNFTVRFAIYNRDQASFSAVKSMTSVGGTLEGWLYIDEIPCDDDQFNSFDIYVQCDTANTEILVHYVQISESALVDGSIVSQPESSATSGHLGVAP